MTIPTKQSISIQELRALTQQSRRGGGNKYGAKRVGGNASRKEHNRAAQLLMMQRAGIISNLRQQVRFNLIPPQRDYAGTLIERACDYIDDQGNVVVGVDEVGDVVADFVYTDDQGNVVVEDTKGFRTRDYIIKRKLMLFVHGIRLKET